MWNNLSMKDKANIIALGVKSGITNLDNIKNGYNDYAREGYKKWKEAIRNYKGIDVDNDPTYDYEGYYNSNPNRAWDMMKRDSNAHFTDEFKTALHPSFSNESRYSGSVNKFNPQGLTGGTWLGDNAYRLSEDQLNRDWDTDRTLDYFKDNEPTPVDLQDPTGSSILRSVEVTAKRKPTFIDTLRNKLTSIVDSLSESTYATGGDLNKSLEDARNSTISYNNTIKPNKNINGTEDNPVELPGVTVYPRNVYLDTYYPFSKGNFIGHSSLFLKDENPYNSYADAVDVKMHHKGYNLANNNCSNATNRVLENYFNEDNPTVLFTTPGDVRDFWQEELKKIGRTPVKVDTGEPLHDRSFISLTGEEFERMAQAMGKESDKYYSEKAGSNRRRSFSDWRKNYGFIPDTN